mgnify:CR=1 FL=1
MIHFALSGFSHASATASIDKLVTKKRAANAVCNPASSYSEERLAHCAVGLLFTNKFKMSTVPRKIRDN